MKKNIYVIFIDIAIVLFAVYFYSPGFIGLSITSGNLITTVNAVAVFVLLAGIFVLLNMKVLNIGQKAKAVKIYKQEDFDDTKDYLSIIEKLDHRYLGKELNEVVKQIERFTKKVRTIDVILLQFFDKEEMSYKSYVGTIGNVGKVFYGQVQNIINRVIIFDAEEYAESSGESQSCREHRQFVDTMIDSNNALIDKVDRLLIEVSKLTDAQTSLDDLPAMHDLEDLINNTKYYK